MSMVNDKIKNEAKSIFVANVKGGVGKSTLNNNACTSFS